MAGQLPELDAGGYGSGKDLNELKAPANQKRRQTQGLAEQIHALSFGAGVL
jgi:hypothetical protein